MSCTEKIGVCQLFADYQFPTDKMSGQWAEILDGTATSNWIIDKYIEMQVPAQNDRVVRQTTQYFPLFTGKYKKCLFTCVLNTITDLGYTSRIGNYDDHNDKSGVPPDVGGAGIFFEYTDNVLYVGIRYGTIDNGTDTLVAQTNFNVNDLGRNSHLNITSWDNIYTFDITFSNSGTVEWAIYIDGERVLLHREQNIIRILNTLPRFNQPLRLEIIKNINDAGATTGEMRQFNTNICYAQGYEAPAAATPEALGHTRHLEAISNLIYTIDDFNYKPIFSFRLKLPFNRDPILSYDILYLVQKKGPFMYKIVRNGTPNNPVWIDSGHRIEYDISSDDLLDYTDDIRVEYVDASGPTNTQYLERAHEIALEPLTSDIGGTPDIFTLCVRKMSPIKVTANFMLRWIEIDY